MDNRQKAYIWLAMSEGLGPRRIARLFAVCGDVEELFSMTATDYDPVVGQAAALAMQHARDGVDAMADRVEELGLRVVSWESPNYPRLLLQVTDPPVVLFQRGEADLNHPRPISMVGSRRCTRYGREIAQMLATELAKEGVCVVSGLARGIDSACHAGALAGGGPTIAVLGCGPDVIYPPENAALYEQIVANGAILSEYLPGSAPTASHFPLRNRIIAGMCPGLVLVEAAPGSGAMITVDYALDHGREIFAVPGNVTSSQSTETNRLLRDGAKITTRARDILEEFGWEAQAEPQRPNRAKIELSPEEEAIVRAVYDEEKSFEELRQETGIPAQELNSYLTMLSLRGIMKQSAGRVFSLRRTP